MENNFLKRLAVYNLIYIAVITLLWLLKTIGSNAGVYLFLYLLVIPINVYFFFGGKRQ